MWEVEWYWAAVLSAIVCMIGGIAHIIVPPVDTDRLSMAKRLVASFMVGFVVFFVGVDPRTIEFPSGMAFAWATGLIASGYFSLDILKNWVSNPPVKDLADEEE